jgi:ABC-type multidrug transport system ATPase subunit
MIFITALTKQYGEVLALNDVNLWINTGEFVALLGPNGSGKSTLFRSLLGIHTFQGSIRIDGLDPISEGKQVRARIGYMPQHSGLHADLTVQETLNFYCKLKRCEGSRAISLLDSVKLTHKLDSRVTELSGGMRQRLSFVVAMLSDPEVLLLDEPTASLDAESQVMILELLLQLHAQGKTILISTHSKQDIMSLAVRAITLEDGKVVRDEHLRSKEMQQIAEPCRVHIPSVTIEAGGEACCVI